MEQSIPFPTLLLASKLLSLSYLALSPRMKEWWNPSAIWELCKFWTYWTMKWDNNNNNVYEKNLTRPGEFLNSLSALSGSEWVRGFFTESQSGSGWKGPRWGHLGPELRHRTVPRWFWETPQPLCSLSRSWALHRKVLPAVQGEFLGFLPVPLVPLLGSGAEPGPAGSCSQGQTRIRSPLIHLFPGWADLVPSAFPWQGDAPGP